MAYSNPGWTNGSAPYINGTNLNNLSNEVVRIGTVINNGIPVANGGTGANSSSGARTNLGLNTTGINALVNGNALPISCGGTGATSASAARTNLGLGTAALLTAAYTMQVYAGRDYKELKGLTGTPRVNPAEIGFSGIIYIGSQSDSDGIIFTDLPAGIASENLYLINICSPRATTTRRINFVIPEVGGYAVYMKITHGSTATLWTKMNFTVVE